MQISIHGFLTQEVIDFIENGKIEIVDWSNGKQYHNDVLVWDNHDHYIAMQEMQLAYKYAKYLIPKRLSMYEKLHSIYNGKMKMAPKDNGTSFLQWIETDYDKKVMDIILKNERQTERMKDKVCALVVKNRQRMWV